MKILVVGGGGREHALCWKLADGRDVEKIYCAPGNAGTAEVAENVPIGVDAIDDLAEFAAEKGIDLAVVGPEAPLCAGLADALDARGIRVFGPKKAAAELEGSKAFSKDFMERHGIPTAKAAVFHNRPDAEKYVSDEYAAGRAVVVKADGLAAGKGVVVAETAEEALAAVETCFSGKFGAAGEVVVVEELLRGEEASILALTDGKTILPLASSQDHKRVGEGDTGPNTGGMGAYSPAPVVTDELMAEINEKVLGRFLEGLKKDGLDYKGVIYAGIMATADGPKVLEFNVRFGDPETQAVLTRLESDLADAMMKTAEGRLDEVELAWSAEPAVCVVMAAGGYPGSYRKGDPISGLAEAAETGAVVFHAGTKLDDGNVVTAGGRVLGVTAKGADIRTAVENAYAAVEKISWNGAFFRRDIAKRAIDRLR
jgi:phosphoribosylamine--glycine ligase